MHISKKIISMVGITAITLALAGCAASGNQSLKHEDQTSVSSKLIKNETTKSQVRSYYGDPAKTSFTDQGNEIWEYDLADVSADAVNYIPIANLFGSSASGTKKQLVVMFKNDKVFRFSMSSSPYSVKTGLYK